jgi:hypothetical protein
MGTLVQTMVHGVTATVAARPGPRREQTRRADISPRSGRPLVTGASPDHGPAPRAPGGLGVLVRPAQPARPFALYTQPRRRLGPVPKLAPGHQGSGLGRPVMAGFQSPEYPGFTPMDYAPDTNPDNGIAIPQQTPGAWQTGKLLMPSWNAHDFAPARRFFMQNRSSGMWAQTSFPPQQRALTPSQQAPMLRRPAMFARRQIPAGQPNPGLYTFGYPTAVGVAARLGGGPIAVLGGNSQ